MAFKKLKYWFDLELAKLLSEKIKTVYPKFNSNTFCEIIANKIDSLELKDRVEVFADEFHYLLQKGYEHNISILLNILGPENEDETGMFKQFYWMMPIAKYVEKYGVNHFDISIKAIEEITKRNTGEYAIRPFLERCTNKTLTQMFIWSKDENKHVRRLASEGIRPRLPWATKLQLFIDNPTPLRPILENLKDDTSKYVQKSVANCLNDILKDNEDFGKEIIENWIQKPTKQRKWIVMHAIRNYRKKEDLWSLKIVQKLEI
ncbi:DNA alkylation repair protein [Polaribacter sp.]|uniref:DNA alkylation repair protein n=1 Tax=Polaribacter sp. TaxID=1920175 RepID=UPI003EF55DCB